jgi:hypothetical protein
MITSPEYQQQLKKLHEQKKNFGNRTVMPDMLKRLIESEEINSILDFGCGKGLLANEIKISYPKITVYGWDPAFNKENDLPNNVDLVITTDVLEHIELENLDDTLLKLKKISTRFQYHLIACHKAVVILPDGRNAHLIVRTPDWWQDVLRKLNFNILEENIISRISTIKKEKTLAVVKYECVLS